MGQGSGNIELILGVCYRNPALPVAYWERLTENISEIVASFDHNKIVLVGDFNDDLLNPNKHHLKDIINHFSFHQLVDAPTRSTHNTNTLLDPIIVGDHNLFRNVTVLPPNCSDHNPILAKIEQCTTRSSHKRKIRLYKHANWTSLKRDLSNQNWNELTALSLDEAVEYFNSILITKCDQYIPHKSVRFSSKDKAWITGEIKIEMDVRDKLFKNAKRSGLFHDFEIFKQQRNLVNDLIRMAKRNHLTNLANKLTETRSEKDWWKLVKSVCGQSKSESIPTINHNNESIQCPKLKANIFNEYFANICNVDDSNIDEQPDQLLNPNTLSQLDITLQEVKDQLTQIKTSKATGPDEIGAMILRNLRNELSNAILTLFRRSTSQGVFPACWKRANVVPIFKKADKSSVTNYRPVSLLPILGKILESIVHKHTYNHIKNFITPHQSGFLPQHSTVTQLIELYHNISSNLDARNEIYILFCDISKAFDRTSHKGILHKLKKLGINGTLLTWFKNYLSDRQQRVVIDGKCSAWLKLKAGIPQGSVLGPLLFIIFINDLPDSVQNITRLFADDATNSLASVNISAYQPVIQSDIDQILVWGDKWSTTYSETKTEYMLFSRRDQPSILNLTMNNNPLNVVAEHKHLGLLMNYNGTWHNHISSIIDKANKRLGFLKKLKYTFCRSTLTKLYVTYVRSILEYGDVVWDNLTLELENKIETVQIDAMRCITGLTISTSKARLYAESGIMPLNKRRKLHRLIMFYKILNGLAPSYLSSLLPIQQADRHRYETRNNDFITNFRCRTELFRNSFFPRTIRDWNALPVNIREKPSLSTFKSALSKTPEFNLPKPLKWHDSGTRFENIHVSRMRNKCSGLASDLFRINIRDSPICQKCNTNALETADHFILHCPEYNNHRFALLADVNFILGNTPITSDILLSGSHNISEHMNIVIMKALCKFVKSTKRFQP